MTVQLFVFYVLSIVAVASAVMVISVRNPVHSVLFLILTFFNAAGLFVLIGAEFLAMVLVVVYVGAVAVLFLFVVMMLEVDVLRMRHGLLQYLPVGALVGLILLVELVLVVSTWAATPPEALGVDDDPIPPEAAVTNTEALGNLLYTEYFYLFQAAGLVLLVAMIGAITLTHRARADVRRQRIARQVHRRPEEAIELRKVTPGSGI